MRLSGPHAHDRITHDHPLLDRDAAQVTHSEAIVEDALGPGKLVGRPLDADDLTDVGLAHGPHDGITGVGELVRSSGHG